MWKSNGTTFENQISARAQDTDKLCLLCIERYIDKVKQCWISKHCNWQGLSDDLLKIARCQIINVKLGHQVTEAADLFD